eukprot:symbB.v1.2.004314.t1/scaffold188.1/size279614/3
MKVTTWRRKSGDKRLTSTRLKRKSIQAPPRVTLKCCLDHSNSPTNQEVTRTFDDVAVAAFGIPHCDGSSCWWRCWLVHVSSEVKG